MRFTFVAACRYGKGLLPTKPRDFAVVLAFHSERFNSMDETCTHDDVSPAGVLPIRVISTGGAVADCTKACELMNGIEADSLIADRGYDTNEIVEAATKAGMQAVIPPKKNRKTKRDYDRQVYKIRHLVENAFLHLKQWRGIATRYAKKSSSFLAIVQIRCLALWVSIS